MEEEIINLLMEHCDATAEEITEAFEEADSQGYTDGTYSNNPGELIAFIRGYLHGKETFVLRNM